MANFNNLNKEEEYEIVKAIFKAVLHALVIPLTIMLMVNLSVDGNYGFVCSLGYLMIPTFVYARSKEKDISKAVFFGIWKGIAILVIFYMLMVIS